MPAAGFRTITVSEDIYDKFYAKYEKEKEEFKEKGIFSFSAYITKILLDRKEQDHFKNITEMMIINNSLLLGMFEFMLGGDKGAAQDGMLHLRYAMMDFVKDYKEQNS